MEWLFDDSNDSFNIKLGKFTGPRGVLATDITDVVYMVKSKPGDLDSSALVTLTLASGLSLVTGATEEDLKVQVSFRSSDFGVGKLEVNPSYYYIGFGFKTAAMAKYLEVRLKDPRLKIITDIIHD